MHTKYQTKYQARQMISHCGDEFYYELSGFGSKKELLALFPPKPRLSDPTCDVVSFAETFTASLILITE